jgi:peroxiredoxin
MREDIEVKPYAEKLGFVADPNGAFWKEGIPYNAYSFEKDGMHVWAIRDGWRYAKVINNRMCNHKTLITAKEALDFAVSSK